MGHAAQMEPSPEIERLSESTTWAWRRVKIRRPPQAENTARAKRAPITSLLPWPRKRPMHLEIRYRGGPECWVEIRARGRVIRRPGTEALADLWFELAGWDHGVPQSKLK